MTKRYHKSVAAHWTGSNCLKRRVKFTSRLYWFLFLFIFTAGGSKAEQIQSHQSKPKARQTSFDVQEVAAHKSTALQNPEMVVIPKTTFLMGSPIEDGRSPAHRPEEKPQHKVTVNQFEIGRFLITAEEFCQFLNVAGNHDYFHEKPGAVDWRTIKKPCDRYIPQEGAERCPAFPVTWVGADAYCKWIAKVLDKRYRLPTEAEWELAARGRELRNWPWGNGPPFLILKQPPSVAPELEQAIEKTRPLVKALFGAPPRKDDGILRIDDSKPMPFYVFHGERFYGFPHDEMRPWLQPPVGSFPLNATPDKVYDMLGYFHAQWCADPYHENAYSDHSKQEAELPVGNEVLRSMRGMWQVRIRERFLEKQDDILFRAVTAPLAGDAIGELYTTGRAWSRGAGHPSKGAGIFRVAISIDD